MFGVQTISIVWAMECLRHAHATHSVLQHASQYNLRKVDFKQKKYLHVSYRPDRHARNFQSPFHRLNSQMAAHAQMLGFPIGLLQMTKHRIWSRIYPEMNNKKTILNQILCKWKEKLSGSS